MVIIGIFLITVTLITTYTHLYHVINPTRIIIVNKDHEKIKKEQRRDESQTYFARTMIIDPWI